MGPLKFEHNGEATHGKRALLPLNYQPFTYLALPNPNIECCTHRKVIWRADPSPLASRSRKEELQYAWQTKNTCHLPSTS